MNLKYFKSFFFRVMFCWYFIVILYEGWEVATLLGTDDFCNSSHYIFGLPKDLTLVSLGNHENVRKI